MARVPGFLYAGSRRFFYYYVCLTADAEHPHDSATWRLFCGSSSDSTQDVTEELPQRTFGRFEKHADGRLSFWTTSGELVLPARPEEPLCTPVFGGATAMEQTFRPLELAKYAFRERQSALGTLLLINDADIEPRIMSRRRRET